MSKHILFVCYGLGIGGIEKCLVNLINVLPEEDYDVDILLMNPEYNLVNQIKRSVNLLNTFDFVVNIEDTINEIKRCNHFGNKFRLFMRYVDLRVRVKLGIRAWRNFRSLPQTYDIAVSYSQNGYAPYYVIDKVNAARKILWYHNGAYEKKHKEYKMDILYYNMFDFVVAVSRDCADVLQGKFPDLGDRLMVLRNVCDSEIILTKADAFIPISFDGAKKHIVTVGRLTPEKGADIALEACRLLCNRRNDFCWHWVGDGNQASHICRKIQEYGLERQFILEGNQINPYPFINYADIYAQTSYYEAYSTTITEAKVLLKPIVTTDVGGMRDQLADQINAIIVPINPSDIAGAIEYLLDNTAVCKQFSHNLQCSSFDADSVIKEYEATIFS